MTDELLQDLNSKIRESTPDAFFAGLYESLTSSGAASIATNPELRSDLLYLALMSKKDASLQLVVVALRELGLDLQAEPQDPKKMLQQWPEVIFNPDTPFVDNLWRDQNQSPLWLIDWLNPLLIKPDDETSRIFHLLRKFRDGHPDLPKSLPYQEVQTLLRSYELELRPSKRKF